MIKIDKSYIPFIIVSVFSTTAILVWLFMTRPQEYEATLAMESDAMAITNYYVPKAINLYDVPREIGLKLPVLRFPNPKFGVLAIGTHADSLISFMLDETRNGTGSLLYIDKNNNEDLTDDGEPDWDEENRDYWFEEVLIDVYYGEEEALVVPYPISVYRYKKKLRNKIIAMRNCYRQGYVTLADSSYRLAIVDDNLDGRYDDLANGMLIFDVNRDDILDGQVDSRELFALDASFNVKGRNYRVKSVSPPGDVITFTEADTVIFPKDVLTAGSRAPAFRAATIDDKIVDLSQYRNQVVLIDFWATWCQPWLAELDNLKRIYARHNNYGFEIIGLNIDRDREAVRDFLAQNNLSWPQVISGQGWDMPLVAIYNVRSLPKNYLLDRRGVIRYTDLHGNRLSAKVYELLNEPEVRE